MDICFALKNIDLFLRDLGQDVSNPQLIIYPGFHISEFSAWRDSDPQGRGVQGLHRGLFERVSQVWSQLNYSIWWAFRNQETHKQSLPG